jgi:hypothetical protein
MLLLIGQKKAPLDSLAITRDTHIRIERIVQVRPPCSIFEPQPNLR